MPFLDEVTQYLAAQSVGTLGVDILVGARAVITPVGTGTPPPPQPATPTRTGPIITISETGGTGPMRTHGGSSVTRPSAQISCRAVDMPTARTKLKLAYDALGGADGLHNVLLGTTFYLSIVPVQEIHDLGQDRSGRSLMAFNIDAEKHPS